MAELSDKQDDSKSHRGGTIPGTRKPAYTLSFPDDLPIPIVIAAPHAGRSYPEALWKSMRRPEWSALRLEDRLVDRIAADVAKNTGACLLVAHAPRAMIDLNRDCDDIDWSMVAEGEPRGLPKPGSNQRARSGLGLVPRRLPDLGEIWAQPLSGSEIDARIGQVHAPYHRALEASLRRCRERWGAALLLDLHSMPPLKPAHPQERAAQLVIGDRFGASADDRIVASALHQLANDGVTVAHNRPYAGGYVLDRHSNPRAGLHAIQIEICRSIYLDKDFVDLSDGIHEVSALLVSLVRLLAGEVAALGRMADLPLAAE